MECSARQVDQVLVLDFAGKLDTQTSGTASDQIAKLTEGGPSKLLLNFASLEFISSAALRVVLRTAKQIRAASGSIKVCNATGVVKEVLEISGFDSLLDLHEKEAEALQAF